MARFLRSILTFFSILRQHTHLIAPTHSPALEFSTDASGSLGYGTFFNNLWFQGVWSKQFHVHTEQQSIAWKELFPVYLACSVWGPLWSGKRIILWCENIPVTHILNSKSSKVTKIMDLVRQITMQTLIHNFTLTAQHVPKLDNSVSDSLSRFQMQHFRQLVPTASEQPTVIPESLIRVLPIKSIPCLAKLSHPLHVQHILLEYINTWISALLTTSPPRKTFSQLQQR